jgi:hypothetical protein
MNKNGIKNTLDPNNQVVTFTLPVKMGNVMDEKTLLQPKIQLQGVSDILPQNEFIASGIKSLPSTRNDLQKINAIKLSNYEASLRSNNSQLISASQLPNQGSDFQLYPVTLDFNDQSNANNTEDEYASKWLTRRENTKPSVLNIASHPYKVLLLKGKNMRKREVDEFTKSDQEMQEKNIKKRVSFCYCPRKFATTCRCSVNYGKKGICAKHLDLCPKLKECPCLPSHIPILLDTTPCAVPFQEREPVSPKPTRCPCFIAPLSQTCIPPSENSTGPTSEIVHRCTEKTTTTECCPTDLTTDLAVVKHVGGKPNNKKKIINSKSKIKNNKRSLHSHPKRKHSYGALGYNNGLNNEVNLKKTKMKSRRKSKKVRECSCTCGHCNCCKKHKVGNRHFLPVHHNNFYPLHEPY